MKAPMTITSAILGLLATITGYRYVSQPPTTPMTVPSQTTYLFFDSGGVLFESSKNNVIWQMGPQTLFNYWRNSTSQELGSLKKRYYEFLDFTHKTTGNPYNIRDDEGLLVPQLMADWLRGTRPNAEILTMVDSALQANLDWFKNTAEKKAIKSMVHMIFNPAVFARTRVIIPETVALLKECKQRGFKIYMLSNWDKESIEYMKNEYKNEFALFDGIIISGDLGFAKPEPALFNYVTTQFPAAQSILIDDQIENIEAAQKAGMGAILVNKKRKMIGSIPDIEAIKTKLSTISAPEQTAYAPA